MGKLTFQAALGGTVDLVGPNTASAVTLNLPATSGDIVGTGSTGVITTGMISGQIAVAQGGTNSSTAQGAINTLAGAVTSGSYLRGNGTNVTMSAIQAADVPTLNQNTTGTAANITASSNSSLTTLSALSLPGSQVSGNISGNAANVTGIVAVANGGTGTTTPALVAGTNVTITGTWPNQTINSTGGGGGMVYPGAGIANSTGSAWGTSYGTSGASSVVLRDSDVNVSSNNFKAGWTSTALSTTLVSLTNASSYYQEFTGAISGQVVRLPYGPTAVLGQSYIIINNGSFQLDLRDAGNVQIKTLYAGEAVCAVCKGTSTSNNWEVFVLVPTVGPSGSITWDNVSLQMAGSSLSGVSTFGLSGQLTSTVATGTAPFVVSSTTPVANLNIGGNAATATTVSGTVAVANGGTGLTTTPANGALDIGNGTGFTRTTLTAGSGISITNGAGSITIAATGGTGTVTSVAQSFTGGLISVGGSPITSSGTLALTVAGTSGGIPYFSSASTWATSAALASNALVIGGGAGAAPATTTTGTGVITALGNATNAASGIVVKDANSNIAVNLISEGFVNVAAAGTTTVLTVSSQPSYVVTGSGGQTYQLPDATTLPNGVNYLFNNNQSSGTIVVKNNSSTTLATIQSGGYVEVILLSNATAAGTWDVHNQAPTNVSWSTNTFSYPGSITSATWNGNTVGILYGGTNTTATPTAGGITYGTGTAQAYSAVGTAGQVLTSNGAAAPTWSTVAGLGTVTSVDVSGGTTGLTTSGGPITTTGTITLAGTLAVANGGTGVTTSTGSGSTVLSTSPTLVTPILGTPTSGNLSNCTADGTNSVGYLNVPQNAQASAYTLVLADGGKHIYHASGDAAATYTIPAATSVAYPIGTVISFVNLSANNVTIAITTDTMYLVGYGSTGSRTLSQYGVATATKVSGLSSAGIWIISGVGLT